ncbi:MAG: hypothetical protein GTO03_12100, partial [Planctomycetales bacterium]|nr:hypothetical protein [Planctomycetales bacterium]
MLSTWPIRYKLVLKLALLLVIFIVLAVYGTVGIYSYRNLVRSISGRAVELPIAADLGQHVTDLRITLTEIRQLSRLYAHPHSNAKPPL